MGPFCVTRSNPTHQLTDPTQSNLLQVEKFGPNPTQSNPTQPNPWTTLGPIRSSRLGYAHVFTITTFISKVIFWNV